MKTLHVLFAVSFLFIVSTACQKDNDESIESNEVVIVDGVIKSPKWLINKVDSIAHSYTPGEGGYLYPFIYSVKYENQEYIYINDGLNACWICGNLFYTLSGEPIGGEPNDPTVDLYNELFGESDRTLLWYKK